MTYTITLTHAESIAVRKAIFAQGEKTASGTEELGHLERAYGKLLEAAANDAIARRMQDEGDKYGHD